jgi:hypothetical protein
MNARCLPRRIINVQDIYIRLEYSHSKKVRNPSESIKNTPFYCVSVAWHYSWARMSVCVFWNNAGKHYYILTKFGILINSTHTTLNKFWGKSRNLKKQIFIITCFFKKLCKYILKAVQKQISLVEYEKQLKPFL